jgi:uncharacterized protein YaaN involved in tellurite resistance
MTDENRSSGAAGLEGQEPRQIELTFGDAEGDLSAGAGQSAADEQKGSFAAAMPAAMTAEELMAAASKTPEAAREVPQAAPEAASKAPEGAPAGSAIREHVADAIRDTEVILSPEEQKMVDAFAEKIDITNGAIMQYGAGTQKKMSEFSDTALANVRNKDMGEVGKQISGLVSELQSFDVTKEENGFLRFFKKNANKVTALQAKFDKTEDSVKAISDALEKHQIQLMKDVATLDRMYALNLSYFKELTMYIAAGKKKLAEVRGGELLKLEEKAKMSQDAQDAQAAKDLAAYCNRFEKKLYDLELTRQIALQTGPQIRLVQDSDTMMAEKIQSTIVNTIPLWKNQMVIALGVEHSNQAAKAEREVTDMTNQLLQKNAQQLHTASVETAKASERGVVDMETLRQTNAQLIATLDDVVKIQEEGHQKRVAAEAEMQKMEAELKNRLLQVSRTQVDRQS